MQGFIPMKARHNEVPSYTTYKCRCNTAISSGELVLVVDVAAVATVRALGAAYATVNPGDVIPALALALTGIPANFRIWGVAAESRAASLTESDIRVYDHPDIEFEAEWKLGATYATAVGGWGARRLLTATGGTGSATWTLIDTQFGADLPDDLLIGSSVYMQSVATPGIGANAENASSTHRHVISDYVGATGAMSIDALGTGGTYASGNTFYFQPGPGFIGHPFQVGDTGMYLDLTDETLSGTLPAAFVVTGLAPVDPFTGQCALIVRLNRWWNQALTA